MLKKIKIFLILFISVFSLNFAFASKVSASSIIDVKVEFGFGGGNNSNVGSIKDGIIGSVSDINKNVESNKTIPGFFKFVKNQIYLVIWVIAIFMIVWIGVRIATSRGNPEEFKKAWLHLVYLIIGIFLVFAAWGIVNIVANLKIF